MAALTREKDITTLIEAAAIVTRRRSDITFFIVGDGHEYEALVKQTDMLGVSGSVIFTGRRNDAAQMIAGFDVFALPSRSEGLGSSVLDAMASRVPVVATRTGGIVEMIEDGVSGLLFEPGDSAALA
ncbi:Glycosyltransferase, partial [sediment metagenome]